MHGGTVEAIPPPHRVSFRLSVPEAVTDPPQG